MRSFPTIGAEFVQASLSNTPYITYPHTLWRQSGEVPMATLSISSQRQVTEAPSPLTTESFDGSPSELGASPHDQPRFGFYQVRKCFAA